VPRNDSSMTPTRWLQALLKLRRMRVSVAVALVVIL
jgi:hypothetical protein